MIHGNVDGKITNMVISINGGTPKSSILAGFFLLNNIVDNGLFMGIYPWQSPKIYLNL